MDKSKSIEVYSLFVVLTVILSILKASGNLDYPWWIVFLPLWAPIAYVILGVAAVAAFFSIKKKLKK